MNAILRKLLLLTILALGTFNVNSQVYYWIGGTGNWTDTANWSYGSGGTSCLCIPLANGSVVFDENSFSSVNEIVTIDTNYIELTSMSWDLDLNWTGGTPTPATVFRQPRLVGGTASDTMIINRSLRFHADMDLMNYQGKIFMKGGLSDSLVTAGHTLQNDLTIDTYDDTLYIQGDLSTLGNIYYRRGGVFANDITINCDKFDSHWSGGRNFRANNTVFNLNGQDTVLYVKPMTSLAGANRIINVLDSTTNNEIYVGLGGTAVDWGTLNLNNKKINFFSDCYFSTINSNDSIRDIAIVSGKTLKCDNFNIDGDCGKYIKFAGGSAGSLVDNGTTDWNLDYFELGNLTCNAGTPVTANNTIDLGGNNNFTITEDGTAPLAYYWVGNSGNFYSNEHWSLTSGGVPSGCVPTPNDTAYFDANSFSAVGNLYFDKTIRIATINFAGLDDLIEITGVADTLEVRANIYGSPNITWTWDGAIKMDRNSAALVVSNGSTWNSDFVKTGTGTLNISDDFQNMKDFKVIDGGLDAVTRNLTLYSFYCNDASFTRNLNFSNATINIQGTNYMVDSLNLNNYYLTGSTLNFIAGNNTTIFQPGSDSLSTVNVQNKTSVEIKGDSINYHTRLEIGPGSAVIFNNFSDHVFDTLYAVGTCDSLVTIKTINTNYGPATLQSASVSPANLTVDYALIDNVKSGTVGAYIASNSIVTDSSLTWISSSGGVVTQTVTFTIVAPNDTVAQGTNVDILGNSNLTIPGTANIISSILTLGGVDTTGATTLSDCNVSLTGASSLASTNLDGLPAPTITLNTVTLPGANDTVNLNLDQGGGPAGNFVVDTAYLVVTYTLPFTPTNDTLYWYGDSGDWTDLNHWSYNSGNIPASPATCLPTRGDHVVFDDLSFNSDNQTVTVDGDSYFASMTWATIDDTATLLMNENLTAKNDVTWSSLLSIEKGPSIGTFRFQPRDTTSVLTSNGANVDVNIEFISTNLNDTLSIADTLDIGDFNSFIAYGGVLNTNDQHIHAGVMIITSPFTPTELNLGNSTIELTAGYSDYGGATSTINAGTSTILVDYKSLVSTNFFRGNNQSFNKVELRLNPINFSQIEGDNTFDTLIVYPGSKLEIDAASTNTIDSLLQMRGTCVDSIFLQSNGVAYDLVSTNPIDAMCLNVSDATATGTFTTYFSTNAGNNTGWTFDNAVSTTAYLDTIMNFCYGDTVSFADTSVAFMNDNVNLTSIWDFGDGNTFTGDTTLHYYESAGTYTLQLISQYSNLCTDTIRDTIEIFAPSVSLTSSLTGNSICSEQDISFYAGTSASAPTISSYEWFIDGAGMPITQDFDTLDLFNLSDTFTVNVNLYENGCVSRSDTLQINVTPVPTVNLSVPSDTICDGDMVNFTSTGATQYRYFLNGTAVTAFTTNPYSSGTISDGDSYFVIGKNDTTGCSDTSNVITFTVNPLPTLTSFTDSDLDNIICAGDTVTFTGVSPVLGSNYLFYINNTLASGTTASTVDIDSLSNGDVVHLVIQDTNTCYSAPSASMTYTVNPIPAVAISANQPNTICEGTPVQFTGSNASLYEYFVNGTSIGAPSPSPFYNTDTLSNGDVITVEGELLGCIGTSANFTVTVNPLPVLTLASDIGDTICSGEALTLTANSAVATAFEFYLNGTSVYSGTSNNFTYTNLTNGNILSVTGSASGCTYTSYMPVTVFDNPNPTLLSSDNNNLICQYEPITFTGTGANAFIYYVNSDSLYYGSGAYLTDSLPPGVNSIQIEAINTTTGCTTTTAPIDVTVTELPTTSISSSSSTICEGENVTITATSAIADNYQYFVNGLSQGLPSASSTFNSSIFSDGDEITVIAFNSGCSNPGQDTVTLTVNPNPVASLSTTPVFCQGSPVTFTANSDIVGSTIEFIIDGNTEPAGSTFDASTLAAGAHTIEVLVTSPNGCTDSQSNNITVLDLPIVTLTGNNAICEGESITFNATGASSYQYYLDGAPVITGPTYTTNTLTDGNVVSVSGTSSAGCSSANTPQITVSVTPTPTVTLVSDDLDNILCTGETVTFTASGATNYEFFVNGTSQGAPSTTATFVTSNLTNGQTVTVEGEASGCIDYTTAGIQFSVFNAPIVTLTNLSDTVLCVDSLTQLEAAGADEYLFYVNGIAQGSFNASNTYNNLLNDGDIITVEGMTNTCVSSASESYEFSVFNYPTTQLTSSDADNIICFGENVTFNGTGATTYEFFVDGISLGDVGSSFDTDQLIDGQTITLVGYNAECPTTAPQSLTFTVNTLTLSTALTPSNVMLCEGESLTLDASGADEYEIFVNGVSQGPQSATNSFVLNNLNNNDYITLNGYSTSTGCTQTDDETIYVQVFETPIITVDDSNIICEGDSTILISNSLYGNQWYLNGSPIAGATDTSYVVYTSGDYSLEITNGGFGEIWSVGYNANGEFGDNTNINSESPVQSDQLTDIVKVTSGVEHTLSLDGNGVVYVSGDNSSGQLGNGTYTASNAPITVASLPAIADIAAGQRSSIAVATTGEVFTWGGNNSGQLGLGNTTVYNTPQWVIGLSGVTNVAAGRSHFVVLRNDGTVWSCGNNDFGQLGQGNLSSLSTFTQVPGLTNITKISSGDYHSMAIDNSGTLYVWGDNSRGQLGLNDLNNRMSPTVSPLENVEKAAGGNGHSIFVTSTNNTYTSGANNYGQLGTGDFVDRDSPTLLTDINAVDTVAAGGYHSLFRKIDGTVWGTGRNDNHQLGNLVPAAIETITVINEIEGVSYIDGGNENSHFIYGNSNSCTSASETITVQSAPQPVIVLSGGQLSTTATGISYQWFINDIEIINSDVSYITPSENGDYTVAVTYGNGCVSISEPFNISNVGIEDVDNVSPIVVYPNPTKGETSISWGADQHVTQIILTDVFGKEIFIREVNKGTQDFIFDLTNYSLGVYHVNIITESGSRRIIPIVKQ